MLHFILKQVAHQIALITEALITELVIQVFRV